MSSIFLISGKNSWTLFSLHGNYRIEANAINEKRWYHVDKNRAQIQPFLQPFSLMGNMPVYGPHDWGQRLDLIYPQPNHFPKGTVNYQCKTEKMLITWAKLCSCLCQNNIPDCTCFRATEGRVWLCVLSSLGCLWSTGTTLRDSYLGNC